MTSEIMMLEQLVEALRKFVQEENLNNSNNFKYFTALTSKLHPKVQQSEFEEINKILINFVVEMPELTSRFRRFSRKKLMNWMNVNIISFRKALTNAAKGITLPSGVYAANQVSFISFIIEEFPPAREAFWPCLSSIIESVANTLTVLTRKDCNNRDLLFKTIKLLLQILQWFETKVKEIVESRASQSTSSLKVIGEVCIRLLSYSKEEHENIPQLCGTALGYMVGFHDSTPAGIWAVSGLLSPRHGKKVVEIMPHIHIVVEDDLKLGEDVSIMWLLRGVLSCHPSLVFHSLNDPPKEQMQDILTASDVLKLIMNVCKSNTLQYHGFNSLNLWWKNLLKKTKLGNFSMEDVDPCTASTLLLVWDNWDSQIPGAVDLLMQVFSHVVDLHLLLNKDDFITSVCDHLASTSNHVKGKYLPLALIINKIGASAMLRKYPNLIESLVGGLGTKHLASCSAKVYKEIVSGLFRKTDFDLSQWEKLIAPSLLEAVTSVSPLVCQNALHYWLPINLQLDPSIFLKLTQMLMSGKDQSSQRNPLYRERTLSAAIGLFRMARRDGIVNFSQLDADVISEAIVSRGNESRMDAFWVICKNNKKSQMISCDEFRLLRDHIPLNLNINCPSFRHDLVSCVKLFLTRISRSSFVAEKQADASPAYVARCMDFVSWMSDLCINSLLQSSSFQRKITALGLYKALLSIFTPSTRRGNLAAEDGGLRLTPHIAQRFNVDLPSAAHLPRLLALLEDPVPDCRDATCDILIEFYKPEALSQHRDLMLKTWKRFLNSSNSQVAECGSAIVEFYLQMFILTDDDLLSETDLTFSVLENTLSLLQQILNTITDQFIEFKRNFLRASSTFPLFGNLSALSNCLDRLAKQWATKVINPVYCKDDFLKFLLCTIDTSTNVIRYLLKSIFSCTATDAGDTFVASADFQEMSLRVEDLITRCKDDKNCDAEEAKEALLSSDHETIFSTSWLALKNSCSLLSSAALFLLNVKFINTSLIDHSYCPMFNNTCNMFVTVLSSCRHRGVIESCYTSFVNLCVALFSSKVFRDIPVLLLDDVLHLLGREHSSDGSISGATITRRSAGLPLISDAILSASVASLSSHSALLSKTMKALMEGLNYLENVPEDSVPRRFYLPQVDALYILKNIFRNNVLGLRLQGYVVHVFMAAVNCLKSSLWVVRNAATHLLGALSSRMLGQKHVETESCSIPTSSLTASEFFFRFPQLLTYFRNVFTGGHMIESSDKNLVVLSPEIQPIISLLSKLSYSSTSEIARVDVGFMSRPLQQLLTCPLFSMRALSARLILTMFSPQEVAAMVCDYFLNLLDGDHLRLGLMSFHQNELHGWLNMTEHFVTTRLPPNYMMLSEVVQRVSWVADPRANPCPWTAAVYIRVVTRMLQCGFIDDHKQIDIVTSFSADDRWRKQVGFHDYMKAAHLYNLSTFGDVSRNVFCENVFMVAYIEWLSKMIEGGGAPDAAVELLCELFQEEDHDRTLEVAALELLVTIGDRLIPLNVAKSQELWEHIFRRYNSTKCLSLRCLLLEGMSTVLSCIFLKNDQNAELLEHLSFWVGELRTWVDGSSEPVRKSTAKSLRICGDNAMRWIRCHAACEDDDLEVLMDVASSLVLTSLYLLQDEQPEVRDLTCLFVSTLCARHTPVHHNVATEMLVGWVSCNIPAHVNMVGALMQVCLQTPSIDKDDSRSSIFYREPCNVCFEPEQVATLIAPHTQKIAANVSNASSSWMSEQIDRCVSLLRELGDRISHGWKGRTPQVGICSLLFVKTTLVVARQCPAHHSLGPMIEEVANMCSLCKISAPGPVQELIESMSR